MIVNRQHSVRVPMKSLGEFLVRARRAVRLNAGSLTVCLVSNAQMARWNRAYRGKQGPTDVLSFPADVIQRKHETHSISYLGDIAIAPAVARDNARKFGRTFRDEMRVLILHGILHLMGYDHEIDTGQMERRERRLRRALGLG
jgi:probable rRNA maturation factor